MVEFEYKGKKYVFIDTLRFKHVKKIYVFYENEPNPLVNDDLLKYILSDILRSPQYEDIDEIPIDELVFIMQKFEELQKPLMAMVEPDELQKKLPQ